MGFTYKNYEESDAVKKYRQQLEDNSTYNESDAVKLAREAMNAHDANKVEDWTGGTYGEALKGAVDRIANREKFTYDLNADMLYQQYKDQYIAGGKLAMMDTMGQAAALTGGYGNSYANAVGNQAYQGYLQKLNDVVPELYQLARDAYDREGQDMHNQMNMYNQMYQTEYGQHRDAVNDWSTEANRLQDRYYNETNQDYSRFSDSRNYYNTLYNNERQTDYGRYSDDYSRAFAAYQQQVAEEQWAKEYALQQAALYRSSSGGSGGSSGSSGSKLKSPTDAMYSAAMDAYYNGGKYGLAQYVDRYSGTYDMDGLMDYVLRNGTVKQNTKKTINTQKR